MSEKKPPLRAANETWMVSESLTQAGPGLLCLVKKRGRKKKSYHVSFLFLTITWYHIMM